MSTKQIYLSGKQYKMKGHNIVEIIQNLYKKGLAEAWFIGMEWPEGYHYCQDIEYLKSNAEILYEKHFRSVWFACRFLD
jgi:hypothetical protein